MFVVNLSYIRPLDIVEKHLPEHRAFLVDHYNKGVFIASGRKVPRTGGIILARGGTRQELEKIMEQDPFIQGGIADYEITQFTPSLVAEGLEALKE